MVASKKIPSRAQGQMTLPTPNPELMNNFVGGLKTEFTGLNFPENSCVSTENCVFTLIGDVTRRNGIDFETNFSTNAVSASNVAINTYKWNNVGGDGLTQIIVTQVGGTLYFYQSTNSTIASPLSSTLLGSTVTLSTFQVAGAPSPNAIECQFSDGNGYLFVYHPSCDPFFCTFNAGVVTGTAISVKIRDFQGIIEPGVSTTLRPLTLTAEHQYNLLNQGWASSPSWASSSSTTFTTQTPTYTQNFTIATGLTITAGQAFVMTTTVASFGNQVGTFTGTVTSYTSGTGALVTQITSQTIDHSIGGSSNIPAGTAINHTLNFVGPAGGTITIWNAQEANYPSNADIWYLYKDTTGVFHPSATIANVSQPVSPAPTGSFVLSAFNQDRTSASGVQGLTAVTATVRPKTGTWFQGRVWYSGVDASFQATGDATYYTWTENIYFSQIIVDSTQFGMCYQDNDPTSQNFFDLLPSDGGVIVIQGSGSIYKLVPIQNGLLVFAANGIWFITGNTGIGFTANDFAVQKVSNIQSISGTSIINVQGTIFFWNEEGIYSVSTQAQQGQSPLGGALGGVSVQNICLGTILSFYQNIPLQSKKFVRGDYNPVTYVLKWIYRGTNEAGVSNRWNFDSVLNFNVLRNAFYPYQILNTTPYIAGINYVAGPGGSTSPSPDIKYFTVYPSGFTFSQEKDNVNWVDFFSFDSVGVNYSSFFQTSYSPQGGFLAKIQPLYVNMYLRGTTNSYQIQSIFDFSTDPQSGRFSTPQVSTDISPAQSFYGMVRRRHRVRGNGHTFQILVSSILGQPFDIMGWSLYETKTMSIA